jgi:peptidoglycan/LPS O-acetylase OafA/YrhL
MCKIENRGDQIRMNWLRNTFEISHAAHKAILSMEGIRGFAVFLVFLVHYVTLAELWVNEGSTTYLIAEQVRNIGNVGVDLFFVLSGYLIYGMLIRKKRFFGSYFARRVRRIYPTFIVVFIIYLLLSALFPGESKIPAGWEGVILVIQNFLLLPGLFEVDAIITVAWSLSYEFFYYLFIPLLIAIFRLRSWPPLNRLVFFLLGSILFFWYFAVYEGHIRLLMFASGILLFETTEAKLIKKLPPIGLPALIIAITAVVLLNAYDANGWWKFALLYCLFFIFCLECFISSGMTAQVFSFPPMRWLGNMSYSYYLLHSLVLRFIFLILEKIYPAQHADSWLFWSLLPLAFFITLIPSAILFIFVEKPFSLVRKPTTDSSS